MLLSATGNLKGKMPMSFVDETVKRTQAKFDTQKGITMSVHDQDVTKIHSLQNSVKKSDQDTAAEKNTINIDGIASIAMQKGADGAVA